MSKEREQLVRRLVKELADGSPEGDWYLLPHGAQRVVGYIDDETIGSIAYKGKPMNVAAVIEEAVFQVIKKLDELSNAPTPKN